MKSLITKSELYLSGLEAYYYFILFYFLNFILEYS